VNKNEAIQRIANEAYLHIGTRSQQLIYIEAIKSQLPLSLKILIENDDEKNLFEQLKYDYLTSRKNIEQLEALYTLSLKYECCHNVLLKLLAIIPFNEKNYFKCFRHLLKMSEFRLDSAMFALITLRIEMNKKNVFSQDSSSTQNYLRRRIWRTLKHLGEIKSTHYVTMAQAMLLLFKDTHAAPSPPITSQSTTELFYPYSHYLVLNHILYKNSQHLILRKGKNAWRLLSEKPELKRTEAFPELWDKQPHALLFLLLHSQCRIVHQFIVKALRSKQIFCQSIDLKTILLLLKSPYIETAEWALFLSQLYYQAKGFNKDLIFLNLRSFHQPNREQLIEWITHDPNILVKEAHLLAQIITSPYSHLRDWIHIFYAAISSTEMNGIDFIHEIMAILKSKKPFELQAIIESVLSFLEEYFKTEMLTIDFKLIEFCLLSTSIELKYAGARLLLSHQIAINAEIPVRLMREINISSDKRLALLGIQLFHYYDDPYLLGQYSRIVTYCFSENMKIQEAIIPSIARLAKNNDSFSERLFQNILNALFRIDLLAKTHTGLIKIMVHALSVLFNKIDKNLRWRLIHSQSKGAQQLGAISLEGTAFKHYTVKQWSLFSKNEIRSIRDWAMEAYHQNIKSIKLHKDDALQILNSPWSDVRFFAMEYFKTHFKKEDWTPESIIRICDHSEPDIQSFGCELMISFFEIGNGVKYLTQLSQHPSKNIQLFTTNFLFRYAEDDLSKLMELESYILSVLSNVYRGRMAKERVLHFLKKEGLKNKEHAQFVAHIFERQSLTYSSIDKAFYIEGMYQLKQTYPDISIEMKEKTLDIKPIFKKGSICAI
jgi:hypothetical protein